MGVKGDKSMIPKVYSFPRSGTHFLMATLKRCFYPNVDLFLSNVAGYRDGKEVLWGQGHWANMVPQAETEYGKLFGSHILPVGAMPEPSIYLYRDGRDVAVSLWRTKALQHPDWHGMSFSEFLRTPLDWQGTPGVRANGGTSFTVAEAWHSHVGNGLAKATRREGRPIYVRYEDLVLDQERTLARLAVELDVGPWLWTPVEEKVGIEPHRGIVGGWREVFSDEDLRYFHALVPRDFPGLWEG